jgi:quinolinate synthase
LAQVATKVDTQIILMSGVYFMGETVKILCPDKKVLVPDLNAGCSLADSCPVDKFKEFLEKHQGYKVVTYVNTSAAIKALTDIVVTSTNAVDIVNSFPKDERIIFGPDRNLGNYINGITGRDMLLWDGACHVHEKFSVEKIIELKQLYPEAEVLSHPECKKPVLLVSDFIGSTSQILSYAIKSTKKEFIIATESGILHEMQKRMPEKIFIPAPPIDSTCGCNDCEYMKLNSLEKIYFAIKNETPQIEIDEEIRKKAIIPIEKMLNRIEN